MFRFLRSARWPIPSSGATRGLCLGAALAGLLPGPLLAGPWPRDKGSHFIALTYRAILSEGGTLTNSYGYYHEWGLTPRLTLGLDLGGAVSGFDKTIAFANLPLFDLGPWKTATRFGIGTVGGMPVTSPGASIGRGWGQHGGWFVVEAASEIFADGSRVDWKVDTTLGRNFLENSKIYLQLQTGRTAGDPTFARLETSVALSLAPRLFLDLGGSVNLANSDMLRLKIGLWKEF